MWMRCLNAARRQACDAKHSFCFINEDHQGFPANEMRLHFSGCVRLVWSKARVMHMLKRETPNPVSQGQELHDQHRMKASDNNQTVDNPQSCERAFHNCVVQSRGAESCEATSWEDHARCRYHHTAFGFQCINIPEGPSTQHLEFLILTTIKGMVSRIRTSAWLFVAVAVTMTVIHTAYTCINT